MGIFSRFADIVNSNISSLLDKAEDPEKMIRLIIQEMEDTLVEVRTHSAKALADDKELTRRIQFVEEQVEEWKAKAALAIQKEREDLARSALIEKQKMEDSLKGLRNEKTLLTESIEKLASEIGKLENKIIETRAKQKSIVMRKQAAGHRRDIKKQLHTGKTEEALSKFEQYERKIDELEAEADSYDLGSKAKDLNQEFAELQADDEIEKELEKLKKSLQDK
ncbi:phage shock protein PspA [Vibrio rumoiensis]|uniref:Phage shock protein PspA n=1 Tax=Vibrio rumoiensis 1S-45 TaxID=1188252 RepID=A0A1E5E439_9VIBR|nr:phage shock protein PspA [Vibrio rumoiensis]OEF27457.1 phage shock protein PspA [Vibrio rumoiensis 1S-45]